MRVFVAHLLLSIVAANVLAHPNFPIHHDDGCAPNCELKPCARLCEPTCRNQEIIHCNPKDPEKCKMECGCKEGFVRDEDSGECVDPSECPCEVDYPITDKPITHRPITDKPITHKPITDKPITHKPITDKPITHKPITDKPITHKPITDKPITHKPITDKPITHKPITHKPITHKPITHKPITHKPITHKPITHKPITHKPITDKPITHKPITDKPITHKPITDKPITHKPITDKPITDKPPKHCRKTEFFSDCGQLCEPSCSNPRPPCPKIACGPALANCRCKDNRFRTKSGECVFWEDCPEDECEGNEPITHKPITDKPITDKPITHKPITDKPITHKPITDKPITDKPITHKPITDKPITDKPITHKPITDKPITHKPITCGKNEFVADCGRDCECTCDNQDQSQCRTIRCSGPGCRCKDGFVRDESCGECMLPKNCPRKDGWGGWDD